MTAEERSPAPGSPAGHRWAGKQEGHRRAAMPETLSSSFGRFWREVEAGHLSPGEALKWREGGDYFVWSLGCDGRTGIATTIRNGTESAGLRRAIDRAFGLPLWGSTQLTRRKRPPWSPSSSPGRPEVDRDLSHARGSGRAR